jgi:NAD(P)-dependent dehydrogenase (short-subunit alcohol dehydrogenase family)
VRVNAVAPGSSRHPYTPPDPTRAWPAFSLVGRLGEISDIVDGILYLEQATFVTGETLHIDGGWAAGH